MNDSLARHIADSVNKVSKYIDHPAKPLRDQDWFVVLALAVPILIGASIPMLYDIYKRSIDRKTKTKERQIEELENIHAKFNELKLTLQNHVKLGLSTCFDLKIARLYEDESKEKKLNDLIRVQDMERENIMEKLNFNLNNFQFTTSAGTNFRDFRKFIDIDVFAKYLQIKLKIDPVDPADITVIENKLKVRISKIVGYYRYNLNVVENFILTFTMLYKNNSTYDIRQITSMMNQDSPKLIELFPEDKNVIDFGKQKRNVNPES